MHNEVVTATPDRRATLKARHRASIVAAARALVSERGSAGFTTDELAARADLARRTVFNHFASLDDVLVACVQEELESTIDLVHQVVGADPRPGPLDDLETALAAPAVAATISNLGRALLAPGRESAAERIRQQAMHQWTERLCAELRARYPEHSALHVELLTTTVTHGAEVLAATWLAETSGALTSASRRRWAELLDLFFTTLRRGFAAPAPALPTTEGR